MCNARHGLLYRISVRGVVQGVGFRPFVYQLAQRHQLTGWVCNTSGDVKIEVEGQKEVLDIFLSELKEKAPPASHVETVTYASDRPTGYDRFEIRASVTDESQYQPVSPDLATCAACLNDIRTPGNRRFRYPFTNCTNCGPRFTIIEDMPYDRPRTTMRTFKMCPACQTEYDDPTDRRFHAQPNACPVCGPSLWLADESGSTIETTDPIEAAAQRLKQGQIVAVKGLGGFLLACDATSETAVRRLRERKRRPSKPLAVMVPDVEEARKYCEVSTEEGDLLLSSPSPIVLLRRKSLSPIAPSVAPHLKCLGMMLPYTPLHHLLMKDSGLALVMTSGNLSEEPIASDNADALRRLHGIADNFLFHNRGIHARYDDSVTMVEIAQPRIIRRARGYAPYPIHLPFQSRRVLACGAESKNTFCLTRDNLAFVSQHIGDMENLETMDHFEKTVDLYRKLFRTQPEIVACDLHPDYLATQYAQELSRSAGLRLVPVQHHHAHVAGCLAENGVTDRAIGVCFDGAGYGLDGAIWGGEFLVADLTGFRRAGHLQYVPLPGGAAAIERPYRMALSYLVSLLGSGTLIDKLPLGRFIPPEEAAIVTRQIERKLNAPLTSSCGRLFDGVSALIGVRGKVDYEAQAAIELEMLATDVNEKRSYPFGITRGEIREVQLADLFSGILSDMDRGFSRESIARKFHNTLASIVLETCLAIQRETRLKTVAISGGVFQNRLLLRLTHEALRDSGFKVLLHRDVPANDGGISLGQAVVANFAVDSSPFPEAAPPEAAHNDCSTFTKGTPINSPLF